MTWKDILKLDIKGLRQTYPALRGLPDEAIREFDRRNSPMINVSRLISELKQKYGVGQRPVVGRMVKQDIEAKILAEIKKEGGALGMKNLKQFGEESEIKRALSKLEKEGKIFMHKDGDIYTHKPK
tara:strand:- start:11449 stop:11826 length:378 start_codon:yes stop_codon:yes gene_type:complete